MVKGTSNLPDISAIDVEIFSFYFEASHLTSSLELMESIFRLWAGTSSVVAFFFKKNLLKVPLMLMFVGIRPFCLILGLVGNLFQPFFRYVDAYKYICISHKLGKNWSNFMIPAYICKCLLYLSFL